jgi:hypothetical protein
MLCDTYLCSLAYGWVALFLTSTTMPGPDKKGDDLARLEGQHSDLYDAHLSVISHPLFVILTLAS